MNRLTAIGLASLVAYGVLIASKYTGVVSAARDDRAGVPTALQSGYASAPAVVGVNPEPRQRTLASLSPVPRAEQMRASPAALEFRAARDLKAFADELASRRGSLTADERYYLARALEECQFAMTVNEDLGAFSAKQRRQFIASLTPGEAVNNRRIAAYDASDNTQRCLRFQGARMSQKEIDDLYAAAAAEGDARAQARLLLADLSSKVSNASRNAAEQTSTPATTQRSVENADFSRIIGLLETRDPEAILQVGQFLSQSAVASQLRIGPNGEVPEPSAFLGAFTLVVCDFAPDCVNMVREREQACAFGGYCNATSFEEIYQNYLASPWAYNLANRYRDFIHTAINSHNWALIGLVPPRASTAAPLQ